MIRRLLIPAALALCSLEAFSQATLDFDIDISVPLAPVATWSTSPAASGCTTSWAGARGPSGSDTLPPVTESQTYAITCDFSGESMATVTWVNPTQNDDGTPYSHSTGVTRLVWSRNGVNDFQCLNPPASGDATVDRPGNQTMHTVTGLASGDWDFAAFAVNSMGLCSRMSNVVAKTIEGAFVVADSISFKVPAAPTVDVD